MAMDTVDALGKPNVADEFIILGGGSDLAPLLTRLKAAKRSAVIYAGPDHADSEKSLADAILDGADFAAFLASDEQPGQTGRRRCVRSRRDRSLRPQDPRARPTSRCSRRRPSPSSSVT